MYAEIIWVLMERAEPLVHRAHLMLMEDAAITRRLATMNVARFFGMLFFAFAVANFDGYVSADPSHISGPGIPKRSTTAQRVLLPREKVPSPTTLANQCKGTYPMIARWLNECKKLAIQGDREVAVNVGSYLEFMQQGREAFEWYKRAADLGDPNGIRVVHNVYYSPHRGW